MSTASEQIAFALPDKSQMCELFVDSGIYAGRWQVDTQLLKTQKGTFIPYDERMSQIEAYNKILTDTSLIDARLQLVPVPVMIAGMQHDRSFYKKVLGTYQLTGSGISGLNNKYLLGTPRIDTDENSGLKFVGLRNDEPIASIKRQEGEVERLEKTAFWGTDDDSEIKSEKVKQPMFMWNRDGAYLVELDVRSVGIVVAVAGWHPWDGDFGGGARLARKLD